MKKVLAVALVNLLVVACGGSDAAEPTGSDPGADGGGGVGGGGLDGGGGGVVVPPDAPPIAGGCDVAKLPSQDACVLHESLGVFVSSTLGADANDGSRLRPYRTIAKGVEAASASHRRVYVCAEAYAEPTLILADGVSVFGNLTCSAAGWAGTSLHAILSASSNPAARATGIATPTRVEGLDLVAPNAVLAGESSIGLIAVNSNALSLVGSRIVAQNGADGADGADGPQLAQDAAFNGGAPLPAGVCTYNEFGLYPYTCPGLGRAAGGAGVCRGGGREVATGAGGAGGASSPYERIDVGNGVLFFKRTKTRCYTPNCSVYTAPESGFPQVATTQTNTGGLITYDAAGTNQGHVLSNSLSGGGGTPGPDGANAIPAIGLSADGYLPLDGTAGSDGGPGQGGGGGYAGSPPNTLLAHAAAHGASGPGGGAGGCPGLAGTAGKGGGASIGILATGSALRLEATIVLAGQAGRGGKGSLGSLSTPGGTAGTQGPSAAAGGGAGGAAGFGGHGASGPSLGIAWSGAEPVLSADSSAAAGEPRAGQPELAGTENVIPAGAAGAAEKVHAF